MDHRLKAKLEKRKELRKFGFSFSVGMTIATLIVLFGHTPFVFPWSTEPFQLFAHQAPLWILWISIPLGSIQLIGAIFWPPLCTPLHFVLEGIRNFIGYLLVAIFYYLIFSPVVWISRLFGKDSFQQISPEPSWEAVPQEENDPKNIEKLF